MSHSIYKSIAQIEPGVFRAKVTDNNVFSVYGGRLTREYHESVSDYWARTMPGLTKEQYEAAMLMAGCYGGDVYHVSRWKNNQRLAEEYIAEQSKKYHADFLRRHNLPDDAVSDWQSVREYNLTAEQNGEELYDSYKGSYDYKNMELLNGLVDYLKANKDRIQKKDYIISFGAGSPYYVRKLLKTRIQYDSTKTTISLTSFQLAEVKGILDHNKHEYRVEEAK